MASVEPKSAYCCWVVMKPPLALPLILGLVMLLMLSLLEMLLFWLLSKEVFALLLALIMLTLC